MLYAVGVCFNSCMDPLVNSFFLPYCIRHAWIQLSNPVATDSVTFAVKRGIYYTDPQECPLVSPTHSSWTSYKRKFVRYVISFPTISHHIFTSLVHACDTMNAVLAFRTFHGICQMPYPPRITSQMPHPQFLRSNAPLPEEDKVSNAQGLPGGGGWCWVVDVGVSNWLVHYLILCFVHTEIQCQSYVWHRLEINSMSEWYCCSERWEWWQINARQ